MTPRGAEGHRGARSTSASWRVRPHPGRPACAANLRALLARERDRGEPRDCGKVQDAYSLRCMPQVHGATRDALAWAREVLEREMNSVTDNPACSSTTTAAADIVSGGNFHGQPLALALDLAAIAVAELANISERRVEQLVNPRSRAGCRPSSRRTAASHSGFMIAQVTRAPRW